MAEATDWTLADASSEADATDAGELLGVVGGLGQRAGRGLELGRGRRHRLDDGADRGLELVGELAHGGLAGRLLALRRGLVGGGLALLGGPLLCGGAGFGLLLLGLKPLHAHQVVAEGLGGAGGIADLVGPPGERHLDGLVAVGELEQDGGDAADRPCDRAAAEYRGADQDQHDHDPEAEIDAAGVGDLRCGLGPAFLGAAFGDVLGLLHQLGFLIGDRQRFPAQHARLGLLQRHHLVGDGLVTGDIGGQAVERLDGLAIVRHRAGALDVSERRVELTRDHALQVEVAGRVEAPRRGARGVECRIGLVQFELDILAVERLGEGRRGEDVGECLAPLFRGLLAFREQTEQLLLQAGELVDGGRIVVGKRLDAAIALLVLDGRGLRDGVVEIGALVGRELAQSFHALVDVRGVLRHADIPDRELDAAQCGLCHPGVIGGALLAVGDLVGEGDRPAGDLLARDHHDHQQDAKARGNRELAADTQLEARHERHGGLRRREEMRGGDTFNKL